MKVIYGGTFDPIHHGHLRLAVEIRECLKVSDVTLMPCHIPPHRESPGASSDRRLELLRLAIEDEPGLVVDDRELQRGGPSYTADTLRQVREELGPDEPLAIVVGTDSFAAFDHWREWKSIPELAHIIVVVRPGADIPAGSAPAELMTSRAAGSVEELHESPGGRILALEPPMIDISATGIRDRIGEGRSFRYLTPDSVWRRICQSGLYRA